MKKLFLASFFSLGCLLAFSQRYFTKNGIISFDAGTTLEDIQAINKSATSVLDAPSGKIEFAVLIKGFEFRRELMQQHFNENYLESHKYPKATFKGTITNIQSIAFQKPGSYTTAVKGVLEIHGVKKEVSATGTLKVNAQGTQATATFKVPVSDYNITVPGIAKDKIAKTATIRVNCSYSLLK